MHCRSGVSYVLMAVLVLSAERACAVASPVFGPVFVYQRPIDAMVDITNDLGVAVLQDHVGTRSNFAFSPYGVASVLVLLYEGARGESARQIHDTLHFPWERDVTRIGFRDVHRHLRTYFSHEGYLSGITLSKNHTSLLPEYQRVLRFYGYDVSKPQGSATRRPEDKTTGSEVTTPDGILLVISNETSSSAEEEVTTTVTTLKESTTVEDGSETTTNADLLTASEVSEGTLSGKEMTTDLPGDTEVTTEDGRELTTNEGVKEAVTSAVDIKDRIMVTDEDASTTMASEGEGDQSTSTEAIEEVKVTEMEVTETVQVDKDTTLVVDETTEKQYETTIKQDATTAKQDETTEEKDATTAKQVETTEVQDETTSKQDETTVKQDETTAKQVETTEVQDETTSKQDETTEDQDETTEKQDETTSKQDATTAKQVETTEVQDATTAKQDETTEDQDETTVKQDKTTVKQVETTEVQDETTSKQDETTAKQYETTKVTIDVTTQDLKETAAKETEETAQETFATTQDIKEIQEETTEAPNMPNEQSTLTETVTLTEMPIDQIEMIPDVEMPVDAMSENQQLSTLIEELATNPTTEAISNTDSTDSQDTSELPSPSSSPSPSPSPSSETTEEPLPEETKNPPEEFVPANMLPVTVIESTAEADKETTVTESEDETSTVEDISTPTDETTVETTEALETTTYYTTLAEEEKMTTTEGKVVTGEDVTKNSSVIISMKTVMDTLRDNSTTRRPRPRIRRALRDASGLEYPDMSLQLQNGMYGSSVARNVDVLQPSRAPRAPFLVDGVVEESVPVMKYTAVFPFAFVPRLHAHALEFPLDDERYKLLLILPVERRGLRQLIHDLGSCPLREVFRALAPTRVHAVIPSFMVEGFVILTSTLQQLGIWDVFDPRRSNLSGMSGDPELFVRNIEQSITVVIRNYVEIVDIQTRTMAARSSPEVFLATHPFLYFVVDTETRVSLMAGKIVDPLNSRIY